jgi:hypothetical protein
MSSISSTNSMEPSANPARPRFGEICWLRLRDWHEAGAQWLPLIDAIPSIRGPRGHSVQRPRVVYADRGYDSERHRRALRHRGIQSVIAKRRTEHGNGLESIVDWSNACIPETWLLACLPEHLQPYRAAFLSWHLSAVENDPCIGVNFYLDRIQRRAFAGPINALSIVKPEYRAMVSAHQNLRPIAKDISGDKVQAYGKMGATIYVGPHLVTTPDNDDGTVD